MRDGKRKVNYVKTGLAGLLMIFMATVAMSVQDTTPDAFKDRWAEKYNIHFRSGGNGPVLLMLHGFTLTGEQWMTFAEQFTDSFTVIVADLPGHGSSEALPGNFSFEESARLMHGLLDELGVDKLYGIGHSAGSMTLLHMANQRKDRLEAMILVSGPHYLGKEAKKMVSEDTWEKLSPETREWYLTQHPGGQRQLNNIWRQYTDLEFNREHVSPESLRLITTRSLIIWGDRDPAFPLYLPFEMYNSLPNAALWIVPQQGHTPLWIEMGGDSLAAKIFVKTAREFLLQNEMTGPKWF